MTKNQSLLFRVLIFLAGAGIVALAFLISRGDRELTAIDGFIWTSIGLMYLIFFFPFFFSVIRTGNFSGKIPMLPLVWLGILLYIAASIGVIVLLVVANILSLNIAIIIQALLLFLFAINVYFACFASSHAVRVIADEAGKQQYINQLKSKAQSLLLSVNRLPAEYEKPQKILQQSIDDIRYISPVDGGAGSDLELRILQSLNTFAEICDGVSAGAHPASLDHEAEKLQMLVKERKLLKN